jgi:hypothetical protein
MSTSSAAPGNAGLELQFTAFPQSPLPSVSHVTVSALAAPLTASTRMAATPDHRVCDRTKFRKDRTLDFVWRITISPL